MRTRLLTVLLPLSIPDSANNQCLTVQIARRCSVYATDVPRFLRFHGILRKEIQYADKRGRIEGVA